jgi:DNA-binding MurR/RpiR family transcriptional regulator
VAEGFSPGKGARGIANNLRHVVEQALQHLDLAAVARAADLISKAGRIVVGGVGGSGTRGVRAAAAAVPDRHSGVDVVRPARRDDGST